MLTEKTNLLGATQVGQQQVNDEFIIAKTCQPDKLVVIDNGSTNGIDLKKFQRNLHHEQKIK